MLFFTRKPKYRWEQADRKETTREGNPGRGWYYIHTYRLKAEMEIAPPVRYGGETLALVLVNIGEYRDTAIPIRALQNFQAVLDSFERADFHMILRVCYDTEGKGLEHEPGQFQLVREHIHQLAPIIKEYQRSILLFQGLLVGNWGEMHGSKFLLDHYFPALYQTVREAFGEKIPLAFRQPLHYRMLFSCQEKQKGIGFFNDAILASETCMGTYAPMARVGAGWKEQWNYSEESVFMREYGGEVPYGGEALWRPEKASAKEVIDHLKLGRVTYLNAAHDLRLLEEWRRLPYEGTSLFQYVGEHLGYRLVIRDATPDLGKGRFVFTIENTGFGPVLLQTEMNLRIEDPEGRIEKIHLPDGDLYALEGGERRQFTNPLSPERLFAERQEEVRIYLEINSIPDGRAILPAQKVRDDGVCLGTVWRRL